MPRAHSPRETLHNTHKYLLDRASLEIAAGRNAAAYIEASYIVAAAWHEVIHAPLVSRAYSTRARAHRPRARATRRDHARRRRQK